MDLASWSEAERPLQDQFPARIFRFGRRIAAVSANDSGFSERFVGFFQDCLEPGASEASSRDAVRLRISCSDHDDAVHVEMSEHDYDLDPSVIETLLPDTRLVAAEVPPRPGWRVFACARDPAQPILAFRRGRMVISKRMRWQMLAAHYFLHHVMRLQQDLIFLHGASVAIGERGVFLGGPKGAGKSTVSLALAARGHGFLGDEVAAIDAATGTLLPFRRAVSVRDGPQAHRVKRHVDRIRPARETLPDGTTRIRMRVSEMFPRAAPRQIPLSAAFLLSGFSDKPNAEPFDFSRKDVVLLGALSATIAARTASSTLLSLVKLFSAVRCYRVAVGGTPDDMADLVERITEDRWPIQSRRGRNTSEHFAGLKSG